jgi:hypothetical protein
MGSAADPGLRGVQARALLSELERQARESIAATGEIDVSSLAETFEVHMDNLRERQALVRYLVQYLVRSMHDAPPDYRVWNPPL